MDIATGCCPIDPWWRVVKGVVAGTSAGMRFGISGGADDSRFLRRYHRVYAPPDRRVAPIRAINFSPILNTPILHHDKDEFLNRKVFLAGLRLYQEIVKQVTMLGQQDGDH